MKKRETDVAMRKQTSQPPEALNAVIWRSQKYASKDQFEFLIRHNQLYNVGAVDPSGAASV